MKDHEIHLDNTEVKRGGDTLMDNEKRQWHWVGGPNKIKKKCTRENLGINKL